ncbi:MAG: hypothetical protein WCB04_03090 [Mycobacteriales bacterium]
MSLVLLQPPLLPRSRDELAMAAPGSAHRRLALDVVGGASSDALEQLRMLPATATGMGFARCRQVDDKGDVAYKYDSRFREYDAYFDVIRVDQPYEGVLAHGLLLAYRSLLEEAGACGTRLSWREWTDLCEGLRAMLAELVGVDLDAERPPVSVPTVLRGTLDPHRRWRVGHHLFFALTQALIVALQTLRDALNKGDDDASVHALRLARKLLRASSAAFVFASEFGPGQYHVAVRPSMEPPHVSAGFTGLHSPDHHYLVRLFGRVRNDLGSMSPRVAEQHAEFIRALESTYEAHKYVCGRFGGETGTSLRVSEASALAATQVIHALKLARTKLVRKP